MESSTSHLKFKVFLSLAAREQAKKNSQQQKNSHKARQVYYNTLAVWAVKFYLECMGVETNWLASDSQNFAIQTLLDVADLVLPGIGKLECRPVLSDECSVHIPFDVSEGRIGYVAVQFDSVFETATLVGFTRTALLAGELPLEELQSLEELLTVLEEFEPLKLSNWLELENTIFDDWLPLPIVFKGSAREHLVTSIRNLNSLPANNAENSLVTVSRGKIIDFGIRVKEHQVALVIKITASANEKIKILAQVYPVHSLRVPKGLKLDIIDENEVSLLQAEARSKDNLIQLAFSGKSGERFSIKLTFGTDSMINYFII